MSKTIMIVRTNEHSVHHDTLGEALSMNGYNVVHAEPHEALVAYAKHRPGAVITCCVPGGHDGHGVIRTLRSYEMKERLPKSYIALMTPEPVHDSGADIWYQLHAKSIAGDKLADLMNNMDRHMKPKK